MANDLVLTRQRATRYHDISCGHRVFGHESKCRFLHGHNYRIFFVCEANELDSVGRVLDFSVMKSVLCEWLEENWDHKFLVWYKDPIIATLLSLREFADAEGLIEVPFNPTAENMAEFLLHNGNRLLRQAGHPEVVLVEVQVEETRKCSASAFYLPPKE